MLAFVALGLSLGCDQDLDMVLPKGDPSWQLQDSIVWGERQVEQKAESYLGRGFDLLGYQPWDKAGFRSAEILDLNGEPWSPWGEESRVPKPEIAYEPYSSLDVACHKHQRIMLDQPKMQIVPKPSRGYEPKTLNIHHRYALSAIDTNVGYGSYCTLPTKHIRLRDLQPQALRAYLSKTFVDDLRNLPAPRLVEKYGTHIVTAYDVGAYARLGLYATFLSFEPKELDLLERSLWDKQITLPEDLKRKLKEQGNRIALRYEQEGSDYQTNNRLEDWRQVGNRMEPLFDVERWQAGLRADAQAFLRLSVDKGGVIPVADLIEDVALKIKYLEGISLSRLYALCNPKDYSRVYFEEKALSVGLLTYDTCQDDIHLDGSRKNLTYEESIGLSSSSTSKYRWTLTLQPSGLWTIRAEATNKYYCVDGQLRTADEDSTGLRYWLLMPDR